MFREILVPADLTDRNRPAVELASRLVIPSEGAIHLLHVIETIPGFTIDEEPEFYQRLEKTAREHLQTLSAPLRERGLRVEAKVTYGPRMATILDETEKIGVDLLVIQSHRFDGERKGQGLGTLSHQVGLLAPCSVLLVR